MPSTLTSRYIDATARSLPADLEQDVREELTASIADAVEARIEQGEDPEVAERAALTELGDPAALAAGYTDRPLHLIGPRYYLTWLRLLKTLLIIVPPIAMLGAGIAHAISGASVGGVIAEAIAIGLSVTVHLFFWVTLVFVILERTRTETGTTWDVDQLPEERSSGTGRADLIPSLVLIALMLGAVAWDLTRGLAVIDGSTLPVLHPSLWPGWILLFAALLLLEAALAIANFVRKRWTTAAAIVNTALAVGFVSWALTLLGQGRLLNPELLEIARASGVDGDVSFTLGVILVVGILGGSAWDAIDGWIKTARDARR
ncbi:permease prefix domain 1-containing protein [Brachybacterium sp.]|uniref:permease prefix domain 1-containing protein n=1 Tax=Brachybacterium sp. TaxID=1891286 RepID=UPI002ED0CA3C